MHPVLPVHENDLLDNPGVQVTQASSLKAGMPQACGSKRLAGASLRERFFIVFFRISEQCLILAGSPCCLPGPGAISIPRVPAGHPRIREYLKTGKNTPDLGSDFGFRILSLPGKARKTVRLGSRGKYAQNEPHLPKFARFRCQRSSTKASLTEADIAMPNLLFDMRSAKRTRPWRSFFPGCDLQLTPFFPSCHTHSGTSGKKRREKPAVLQV